MVGELIIGVIGVFVAIILFRISKKIYDIDSVIGSLIWDNNQSYEWLRVNVLNCRHWWECVGCEVGSSVSTSRIPIDEEQIDKFWKERSVYFTEHKSSIYRDSMHPAFSEFEICFQQVILREMEAVSYDDTTIVSVDTVCHTNVASQVGIFLKEGGHKKDFETWWNKRYGQYGNPITNAAVFFEGQRHLKEKINQMIEANLCVIRGDKTIEEVRNKLDSLKFSSDACSNVYRELWTRWIESGWEDLVKMARSAEKNAE